jgi:hypothetical protein
VPDRSCPAKTEKAYDKSRTEEKEHRLTEDGLNVPTGVNVITAWIIARPSATCPSDCWISRINPSDSAVAMGMRFAPKAQPISRTRARGTAGGFIPNRAATVAIVFGWATLDGVPV